MDTHVYGVICKICQTVNLIIEILIWIDEAFMQFAGTPKLKQFAYIHVKRDREAIRRLQILLGVTNMKVMLFG